MKSEMAFSAESGENPTQSPASGVSILLVDSDSMYLAVLSNMLFGFGYKVITAEGATEAFCILRERQDEVDLILAEASLPDMGKHELVERVREISKLPVIIMSSENDEDDMLGSLLNGAELHLRKPITMDEIKILWQFAFMKKPDTVAASEGVSCISSDEDTDHDKRTRDYQNGKRKDPMDKNESEDDDYSPTLKKTKLIWTDELHKRFLQVIKMLGIDAHPKKILQHMNVPGLTKENISSHLQNYRRRRSLNQEQGVIEKNMKGGLDESHILSSNPPSTISVQGSLFQFQEMSTAAPCQPSFSNQQQKNVNSCMSMHSLGSANCLNPLGSSFSSYSDGNYGKLAPPPSNQLDFSSCYPSYIGYRITSNGELEVVQQSVKSNRENFPTGKTAFSNYVDLRLERAMQWPSPLTQLEEVKEQHQQQLLPNRFLQDQGHGIFDADIAKVADLFDMTKHQVNYFLN